MSKRFVVDLAREGPAQQGAGIVHQHVETAQAGRGFLDQRHRARPSAEIARQGDRRAPRPRDIGHHLLGLPALA